MKVKTLLDTKIQVFNTVEEKTPNQIMTTRNALVYGSKYKNLIDKARTLYNDDDKDGYKATKMRMFAWLPTALCKGDKSNIEHVYPIMCLDIDGKDNPNMDIDNVKQQLINLPFVYYAGLSIGGNGIFALAYIEDPTYYEEQFRAMKYYIKEQLGLDIDAQCGNPNRLRFMSYDNNPSIKPEDSLIKPFDQYNWNILSYEDNSLQLNLFNHKTEHEDLLSNDMFCYSVIDYCIDKLRYQSGGRTTGWMQDLSTCKSLGSIGLDLAIRISRQSSGYVSDEDVTKVFNHRSTFTNRNGLTKFFKICKDNIGKGWIYKIKELYNLE